MGDGEWIGVGVENRGDRLIMGATAGDGVDRSLILDVNDWDYLKGIGRHGIGPGTFGVGL